MGDLHLGGDHPIAGRGEATDDQEPLKTGSLLYLVKCTLRHTR
jgi:hypothetical protein